MESKCSQFRLSHQILNQTETDIRVEIKLLLSISKAITPDGGEESSSETQIVSASSSTGPACA